MTKVCTKCKQEKELSAYYKHCITYDKLTSQCKSCIKIYNKNYRDKNKEILKIKKKTYRLNNKEKITAWFRKNATRLKIKRKQKWEDNKEELKAKHREWVKEHRKKVSKQANLYDKQRRKIDIKYKLKGNLRKRIIKILHGKNKSLNTMFLIGCEIDYLMYHLQEQFTKGMSWDNYGDWHIDHIKPCAKFDLSKSEEQQKCFHYTNLQPLWAEDNLRKGQW